MANLTQKDTIVQYLANGTQTVYGFAFYLPEDGDINVYVTLAGADPIPEQNIKILSTDYTVSRYNQFPFGGSITFLPGKIPPLGANVTLSRDVKASLDVEFSDAKTLNGENLDEAFDRLLLISQQLKTLIQSSEQRVLSYRVNAFESNANIAANTQIPILGIDQIWKGTGSGVIAATVTESDNWSTLRSELANKNPGGDGAGMIGYYDSVSTPPVPTTVRAFLDNLIPFLNKNLNTNLMKPGMMIDFAGTVAPDGFLLCDGSEVSRTTYADLYTAIGDSWGVVIGTATFKVPDFRRRTAIGSGGAGTPLPNGVGNSVGNTGGNETHTILETELATHTHTATSTSSLVVKADQFGGAAKFVIGGVGGATYEDGSPTTGTSATSANVTGTITTTNANTGSNTPMSIMQSCAVVLKIIKF